MTTARLDRVFCDARRRLLTFGWVQGEWRDDKGRICAMQAAYDVCGLDEADTESDKAKRIAAALKSAILAMHGLDAFEGIDDENPIVAVYQWNDQDGRSYEDVFKMFRRAEITAARPIGRQPAPVTVTAYDWDAGMAELTTKELVHA